MANDSHFESRREMEDRWRARVEAARRNLDSAASVSRKVLAEQQKWPLPAPDGSRAVRNALREESAARQEYMRLLRVFTDFVVQGKVPETSTLPPTCDQDG